MGKIERSNTDSYACWRQNVSQQTDQPIQLEMTRIGGDLWKNQCKLEMKVGTLQCLCLWLDLDELADIEMMLQQAREFIFPEPEVSTDA
ncbi:MAG: hypothetical protein CL581_03640 [Alteromonadaceae bacterium]|nr:hypothetical protein [Alteromonadaceae bacterium]|tara:strand:+ start:2208 stop:2474 length:267 start_codon:yes stop_codon:yes gene_type:complete